MVLHKHRNILLLLITIVCCFIVSFRENMGEENINKHKEVMKEFVHRDKNHPCVVMWSVANEPETQYEEAETYFKYVILFVIRTVSCSGVSIYGETSVK